MDTFIGYPVRLATARMVSQGLAALGVPNMGVDTILIFENGLSQVDSPCSGVKSLWSGGLFLLAATWIERRRINRRWIMAVIGFTILLLGANLARVAILVLVGQVANWHLLAEMLHIPLGIVGFLAACLAALGMLRWAGSASSEPVPGKADTFSRPGWLAPVMAVSLILLIFLYTPRSNSVAAAQYAWDFPADLTVQTWPLTDAETGWLSDDGTAPVNGSRWRFQYRGFSGSLLLVASDTWRSHHRPERCFTVYGLEVQDSRLFMASPDFPLRWITLGHPAHHEPLYTAGYWLQSSSRVTDDYAVRIWDDMQPRSQSWVLVTVLFDETVSLDSDAARELFVALRQVVQDSLNEKIPG
jgi:exosortase O